MIIVTGGAGFIGANLVAALLNNSYKVVVCDHFGGGPKWRHLVGQAVEEVITPGELAGFLDSQSSVEAVFHLGAISDTTEMDVDKLLASNYEFSKSLWRTCARRGVRLIYASSAATYGAGERGFVDDGEVEHLAGLRPLNPYGWSKHLFDQWVAARVAGHAKGSTPPQWAGLKFFNVYGPMEDHKGGQASVIWHFVPQIRASGKVRLFQSHHPDYGHGEQRRDFVWVGDCVAVMLWLLHNPGISGLFNVGTGKARSFNDLATAIFTAMDKPTQIEYVPTPDNIREQYQYFTEADTTRLRQAGYNKPFTELEEGVRKYVEFLGK